MKNKIISAFAICLISAFSLILIPACSWFGKDDIETNTSGTVNGASGNKPSAQYSSFLNSIEASKNYASSFKQTQNTIEEESLFEYNSAGLQSSKESQSSSTSFNVYVDTNNNCAYRNDKDNSSLITEVIFKNIKKSNDNDAGDYYIETGYVTKGSAKNTFSYKTNSDRIKYYTLSNITEIGFLPEFDSNNFLNNTDIIGSNAYAILNMDTDYLTAEDLTVDIKMPEKTTNLQIEINATYTTEASTYYYNKFNTTIKYTCTDGKVTQISQTLTLKQCKEANKKRFDNKKYDKITVTTSTIDTTYISNWDTSSEEYKQVFDNSSLLNQSAIESLRSKTLPRTTNLLHININGENAGFYPISEDQTKSMEDIINAYGKQTAYTYSEDADKNVTLTASQIDVKFYFDSEYQNPIDSNISLNGLSYDRTIYGKYVINQNQCVIIVREFEKQYEKLNNYYKRNETSVISGQNFIINKPIICTTDVNNITFNYSYREKAYVDKNYSTNTFIDNSANSTNRPLTLISNKLRYLDFYITAK